MRTTDTHSVADIYGDGKVGLFVYNYQGWFGMIRAGFSIGLQKIYYRWIHNYRYGRYW